MNITSTLLYLLSFPLAYCIADMLWMMLGTKVPFYKSIVYRGVVSVLLTLALAIASSQVIALRQGRTLEVPAGVPGMVRIYSDELGFLGLGELEVPGRLVPLRLISAGVNRA